MFKNTRPLAFLPAIAWFLFSLKLFTMPGTAFPKADWFDAVQLDKFIHAGLFAVLIGLCYQPLKANWSISFVKKQALIIALFGVGYGVAIEFVQKNFIPYRSFDVFDIVADTVGCALAWLWLWSRVK